MTGIINFLSAEVNRPLVKQQFDLDSGDDNNEPYADDDDTDPRSAWSADPMAAESNWRPLDRQAYRRHCSGNRVELPG